MIALAKPTPPNERTRLADFLDQLGRERAWTTSTARHYACVVSSVEHWLGRPLYCHDFEAGWMNDYLTKIENDGRASATVRNRRTHLIALWRAANEAGLSDPPGKVRRVKLIQKAPEAWNLGEVNAMLKKAKHLRGRYGDLRRSLFWRLAIRVLWDTGLRQGDALQLTRESVSDGGVIQLVQGKVGRWHLCKLHRSTLAIIEDAGGDKSAPLVPWTFSDTHLRGEFEQRICKPVKLTGTPKKLRKSSASDVELHHPGLGGYHLGHRLAGNVAHCNYLDPRIVAENRPMPTELTGDC